MNTPRRAGKPAISAFWMKARRFPRYSPGTGPGPRHVVVFSQENIESLAVKN